MSKGLRNMTDAQRAETIRHRLSDAVDKGHVPGLGTWAALDAQLRITRPKQNKDKK